MPILASTLSSLALLLPFLLVPGLTSLLFRELILVVAGVFLVSLALAVTLTPMLTTIIVGREKGDHREGHFLRWFRTITAGYVWLLELSLRYRKLVFGGFTLILLGAVALFPWLGSEFLPRMDDGRVMVKVKLPSGASLTETTNIFGFIPLALNLEEGGEMLQPMAAGAIGGLALGLFVALFLMPCFYVLTAYTRRPPGNISSSSSP